MNHKKKIVAAAAIVALALALVGTGYALTYTGTTTNTGNTVTSTYIQVGANAYTNSFDKEVYYDTNNDAGTITYTLNTSTPGYAAASTVDSSITVPTVKIGTVTLTITETADAAGAFDDYTLAITHDKAITGDYWIGYKIGDAAYAYSTFATGAGAGFTTAAITGAASTTVVIDLYIGVSTSGTTTAPSATPVNDVIFSYVATATAA